MKRLFALLALILPLVAHAAGGIMESQQQTVSATVSGTVFSTAPARTTTTATISNGASLTSAIDLGTSTLARIVIPSGWTTANITFQTSYDCSNYSDFYDNAGSEYTITVGGTSRGILVPIADFLGVRCLKIRSGTTGTPVNQGADRTLNLMLVN